MQTITSFKAFKIFIILCCIALLACNKKKNVLPINQMKVIMLDMIATDEWVKIQSSRDSSFLKNKINTSIYNKAFQLNGVSKEQFYNSYTYYQNQPIEMKELLDSLTNYANRKRDTIINKFDTIKTKAKEVKIKN